MARIQFRPVLLVSALLAAFSPWEAQADAVTDRNVIALPARAVPPNSILQSRVRAIVHEAIYDAVRAVARKSAAYAIGINVSAGSSIDAAVAAHAHGSPLGRRMGALVIRDFPKPRTN